VYGEIFVLNGSNAVGVDFTAMAEYAVQGLLVEVPAPSFAFQVVKKTNRLNIVLKRRQAIFYTEIREKIFSVMAKWCMAYIVPKGDGFNEVFVKTKKTADSSGNS